MDYLSAHRALHHNLIEPLIGKPVGCTPEEVDRLEKQVGFELPLAYKQYLNWMGKDEWGIFQGLDWRLQHVINNTESIGPWLANLHVEFSLPSHYLACFSDQGCQYVWFELPKADEDPIVWWFNELLIDDPDVFEPKRQPLPQAGGSFSDYLYNQLKQGADYLPQIVELHRAFRQSAETGKTIEGDGWSVTVDSAEDNSPES